MIRNIFFKSFKCISEINEVSVDEEIYGLVSVVNMQNALPTFDIFSTNLISNVDAGETKTVNLPVWGTGLFLDPITNQDQVVILVTLMEQDNGSPKLYHTFGKIIATASIASSLTATRPQRVASLSADMKRFFSADLGLPFVMDDDHIATVELRLTAADIASTQRIEKTITLKSNQGNYTATFELVP